MTDYATRPWPTLRNVVPTALDMHQPYTSYAFLEVDVTDGLYRIGRISRASKVALSSHAWVIWCLARAAKAHPVALTFRHGSRLVTFEDADVATTVSRRLPDGTPLAGAHTLRAAQQRGLGDINTDLRAAARAPVSNDASALLRRRVAHAPLPLRKLFSWRVRRNPHLLRQAFGTIGITSLRMGGTNSRYAVMAPNFYTVSVLLGGVTRLLRPGPDDAPVARRILSVTLGCNHLIADGMPFAAFGRSFAENLESAAGLNDDLVTDLAAGPCVSPAAAA